MEWGFGIWDFRFFKESEIDGKPDIVLRNKALAEPIPRTMSRIPDVIRRLLFGVLGFRMRR